MRTIAVLGLGALVAAMLSRSALAFAPTDDVYVGVEPIRIQQFDPSAQAALRSTRAWRAFTSGEGAGWLARFDEGSGTPHRMWGSGIPVPDGSSRTVEVWLRQFADRNAELLGVDTAGLALRNIGYSDAFDTWYVDFDQLLDGHPIYRGVFTARIKHGNLIMAGAQTYPNAERVGEVRLDAGAAIHLAITEGPEPFLVHSEESAELVWLPEDVDGRTRLRLCWQVFTRTWDVPGKWVSFVDADTGELVNVHNEVRFFDGNLSGRHDTRYPNGDTSVSGLPLIRITSGAGESTNADADGDYSMSSTGPYSAQLRGSYLRVSNQAGSDASYSLEGAEEIWTSDDATQAELDTYVFLHQVRDWGQIYAPDAGIVTDALRSNVNLNQVCNAFYDGNVNFYRSGSGCNNTGRLADVNFHEWGHGLHYTSLEAGTFDGSLSEGAGDVTAFLLTGDNTVSPYFFTNGGGIRDVEPNRRYPDDLVGEVHEDGLIFAGAMWDFRKAMIAEGGEEYGNDVASRVFAGLLKGGPGIAESFDEAAVADDDDGNLGNGTPHFCQLLAAFQLHGLGPAGGSSTLQATHVPAGIAPFGGTHPVAVDVVNFAPECGGGELASATVRYRLGTAWQNAPLAVSGLTVSGAIPAQDYGEFLDYYFLLDTADDGRIEAPIGGYRNPFSLWVGDVLEITCEDFEATDGGFTHELLAGENIEGADDWQWGTPQGKGGDPSDAASGSNVWGNDLGQDRFDGEYQDNRHNRLTSPVFETSYYTDVFLTYDRWLGAEDGFYDTAAVLADGKQVWSNYNGLSADGGQNHRDRQWVPHSVDLKGAGNDGEVQLAWEIISDPGLTLGGWNIDNVCLYAPATPDNRLGIIDFLASDGTEGGVTLTWTNPRHAPVERVVVVRRSDAYPSGPTDGTVVYDERSPAVATPVSALDITVDEDTEYYYAVYAEDGEDWLSWTVEGRNADKGSAFNLPEIPDDTGGISLVGKCGCSSAATVPTMLGPMLGLLALIGFRRRRR